MQILPNSGHQMAQNRLKSHRIRVDYAVYERQLFPKAAVQPSTWQANANVALGSEAGIQTETPISRPMSRVKNSHAT
jgi:hypothetical protein